MNSLYELEACAVIRTSFRSSDHFRCNVHMCLHSSRETTCGSIQIRNHCLLLIRAILCIDKSDSSELSGDDSSWVVDAAERKKTIVKEKLS